MNMDFGGIILAELNRRSRINIYLSGSTKPKRTGLDFFILNFTVPISITKHVSVIHCIYHYNTVYITQHISAYHSVYQHNTALISIPQCLSA
jgi:hypothetical protein